MELSVETVFGESLTINCGSCRWWGANHPDAAQWDAADENEDGSRQCVRTVTRERKQPYPTRAYADDYDTWWPGALNTFGDFACNQWEPKE